MSHTTLRSPLGAMAGLLCLLTAGVRLSLGPYTIDDAYITFRYARNIANGLGFVYNPGEHVIGTTTPLWIRSARRLSR